MNDLLRRALQEARLTEGDVVKRLDVDPKTVHRWLSGRIPTTERPSVASWTTPPTASGRSSPHRARAASNERGPGSWRTRASSSLRT